MAPLTTKDGSIQEIKATVGTGVSKIESDFQSHISLLKTFIASKFDEHVDKQSDVIEASIIKGQYYPDTTVTADILNILTLEALRGRVKLTPPPLDFFGFKFLLLDRLS